MSKSPELGGGMDDYTNESSTNIQMLPKKTVLTLGSDTKDEVIEKLMQWSPSNKEEIRQMPYELPFPTSLYKDNFLVGKSDFTPSSEPELRIEGNCATSVFETEQCFEKLGRLKFFKLTFTPLNDEVYEEDEKMRPFLKSLCAFAPNVTSKLCICNKTVTLSDLIEILSAFRHLDKICFHECDIVTSEELSVNVANKLRGCRVSSLHIMQHSLKLEDLDSNFIDTIDEILELLSESKDLKKSLQSIPVPTENGRNPLMESLFLRHGFFNIRTLEG